MQTLNQILNAASKSGGPGFYKTLIPDFISSNLKKSYGKRLYQEEAFGRFIFYWNDYHYRPKGVPTQLLYHMATGSGKTLIMAGLIIYLYQKGYRNFLFFVNSTNIIDKTRDNFLNANASKYLFADTVSIGGKQIRIKEVENFQSANEDDINIVFATIQGLHSRLNTPKENSLTYDDFEERKIVLISDEAHHINAETKKGKKLGAEEKEEIISWEGTVNRIFNANADNILLEFTATADLTVPEIAKKYSDKLIFDYPLRQFRKDGYSKEVKVLQADLLPFDRALQAVLLSQYRQKLFGQYKKLIKPVILYKSKTIRESQAFFSAFVSGIKNLTVEDLQKIKNSGPGTIIEKLFYYLNTNNISLENFITELKEDFSEEKLIAVNSKDESEQKQLAVNSLEDEANEYRAVFAVDKLNEGWDVLNLFDIVRVYDTRDAKKGKPGKTTMAEAQLIGRGARYCPFKITEGQNNFGRKYDDDITNELRICEELYYHSAYNPQYIKGLNASLVEIGIKEMKKSHTKTGFYFLNKEKKSLLKTVSNNSTMLAGQTHKVILKTTQALSTNVFSITTAVIDQRKEKKYRLVDFGEPIIRKALNKLYFYQFSNLKKIFPTLNSISEFINAADYLGNIKLQITGLPRQFASLTQKEKLEVTIKVLENISKTLVNNVTIK